MEKIRWGMIGCGDVTEVKSGPAFSKIKNSSLVAVMRRDEAKVKDYATRHQIAKWYTDAHALINDAEVNAIYIATPPSSHKELALFAMAAGKPVYVEKPMTTNAAEAKELANFAQQQNIKFTVAHYRRAQPKFKKIQQILADKVIGDVRLVQLNFFRKSLTPYELAVPKTSWRVNAETSGGGLFHDISPHQLDLMLYYFGEAETINGLSKNQANNYASADIVSGQMAFKSGVLFSGNWCFNVAPEATEDKIEIIGAKGKIVFSAFTDNDIALTNNEGKTVFSFDELQHVQQPMIEEVVRYFLGEANNPCSAQEGVTVMEWLDAFTK